jgi:hypothetical protein
MNKRLYKLLKAKIPLKKISELLNIPISDIFEEIKKSHRIVLKNTDVLININKHTIVKTSYSFKSLGFPSMDLTEDFTKLLTRSQFYKRDKLYLDGLEDFDFRRKNDIVKILDFGKPIIISYKVPSDKKIPKAFSKLFDSLDISVQPKDIREYLKEIYPEYKGNVDKIYRKCGGDVDLVLNNIMNSELSDVIINKTYTTKEIATLILNSEDREKVFKSLHFTDQPWWFVITWLRQATPYAYPKRAMSVYSVLEFVDEHKFNLSSDYLMSALAYGIKPSKTLFIPHFPRLYKKKKIEVKEDKKVKVVRGKIKKKKKIRGLSL